MEESITQTLTTAVIRYMMNNNWIVVTEVYDPTLRNRIDIFAAKTKYAEDGYVSCVEVKTSSADLRRDFMSHKNQYFVDHSDFFYYAVPRELLKELKELASKSFGIYSFSKDESKIRCVRRALINSDRRHDFGLFTRALRRAFNLHELSYESQLSKFKDELRKDAKEDAKWHYEKLLKEVRNDANYWREFKKMIEKYDARWLIADEQAMSRVLQCLKLLENADALGLSETIEERFERFFDSVEKDIDNIEERISTYRQSLNRIKQIKGEHDARTFHREKISESDASTDSAG